MRIIKTAKTGYIISSLIMCIAGIILAVKPGISIKAVCSAIGIIMIICGVIKIIGYFSNDLYSLAFQHDLAFGILAAIVGLLMVFKAESIVSIINFIVGIIVLLDGLIKIQTAVEAKKFGLEQWRAIGITALLSCILGAVLVFAPFGGAAIFMRIFGICILVEGILNLVVGVFTIKIIDNRDIYDDFL